MDTVKWLQIGNRFPPRQLSREVAQPFPLPGFQNRKRFDHTVADCGKQIRRPFPHRLENIARELTMMRALLDDREIAGPAQDFPHLGELRREQAPEERTDADVREIIAVPTDLALAGTVITEFRMIKRLLHEPVERDRAGFTDSLPNDVGQSLIACEHGYLYRQIVESIYRYIV